MAKSAHVIATDIDGFMKKKTLNVWTLPWAQLYEVASRERIKDAFQDDLRVALKGHALEITYGTNAVVIHRDSNFGPQSWG
ncbi:hypothetical protein [Pseudomonas viridiflava]|uniref:hypothetical protein n=1 Tax=Pseudomonas viridiflava TaxID=33069 RepID=UPI000F02F20D|nr:hypothetical protein [Pseudomonas viridiflava]